MVMDEEAYGVPALEGLAATVLQRFTVPQQRPHPLSSLWEASRAAIRASSSAERPRSSTGR